eukprot:CAMPEP_0184861416 /NCGR_PEP_ID=MMETSP0580-20130426/6107_1 /TAXON_ID=1118495 /ORGANISM="Dactyliosolen fragilissimus" /LENGTH=304 /DNA_ID=CAMNT_0027358907 /DNA_START=175 /DNA_END=1089 /DNA_ORIENTATION=-
MTHSKPDSSSNCNNYKIDVKKAVEYARLCGRLKTTPRTGWVLRHVPNPESVADHSWRVAALSLLLQSPNSNSNLDISKCIEMALVHDLAECIVGDIAPSDNVSKEEKVRREHEAMHTIADTLKGCHLGGDVNQLNSTFSNDLTSNNNYYSWERLLSTFEAYERRSCEESIVVKDLDLLDMILQADEYERATSSSDNCHTPLNLQEFFDGTPVTRFKNDIVREVAQEIHRQREERRVRENQHQNANCTNIQNERKIHETDTLSDDDLAFVQSFAASHSLNANNKLSIDDIGSVVRALRAKDKLKK